MQRLHHAAYVEYLEVVRIECLRSMGFSYDALEKSGYLLPVSKLHVKYRQGARYDELLSFETRVQVISEIRLVFHSEVHVSDRLIATAEVELACIDSNGHRPRKMPERLLLALREASA
jgi:acyl-CoA thioester hydrolase